MADRHGGPLLQLTLWRLREMIREPEAVFWIFAFPILLAIALGVAFANRGVPTLQVAVQAGGGHEAVVQALDVPGLSASGLDSVEAYNRLRVGRVALVIVPGDPLTFVFDSTREESELARLRVTNALEEAAGREDLRHVTSVAVTEPGSRYIDFLIPGLLGLNVMMTGLWGISYYVVRARSQRLLKRFLASPMRKPQFLAAQVLARLTFLVFEVTAILAFGVLAFGIPVRGSLVTLGAVVLVGAMAFSGIGLLVGARTRTIEGVSGLMNVVMLPMWIVSGVFFAWSRFPEGLHPVIQVLPLTVLNDALRAVMLDGAGPTAVAGPVAMLAAWTVGTFGVALWIFRWQ